MSKAREVLAALKRGGWVETRRNGSYRHLRRVMRRRTALHSGSNHARVNAYSAHLGQIFQGWLTSIDTTGYSSAALIGQLDEAAAEWFPRAFANGRNLAYPTRRPSAAGREILAAKILSNRQSLQGSLGPDMDACFAKRRDFKGDEPTTLSDALRASFLARVGKHGGAIWTVTEAGYRAGVQQARTDLAIRLKGSLAAEEGDEAGTPQPGDDALAIALGLSVVELLQLTGRGRQKAGTSAPQPETGDQLTPSPGVLDAAGVRVGTAYEAEDDVDTCDPCAANARGGDDGDGVYWIESECPLPGEDCDALSRCRCVLSTVTDMSEAVAL